MNTTGVASSSKPQTRRWSREEHARFLRGLEMFPRGPWSRIAALVGTRTTRQTMTHAKKYHERIARRADEVQELVGQSGAPTSTARLQETIRQLPTLTPRISSAQLSSSDEDLMEEIGLGGVPAELDDLDMRILLSLLSPESLEPLSAAESRDLDHSIWSLLVDVPGDLASFEVHL
jgi:hypothetical protein